MRWFLIHRLAGLAVLLSGLAGGRAAAQSTNDVISVPDMVQGVQQWAQDNLDTNVLAALPPLDQDAVQQFYQALENRFQGDYVVDMAEVQQTAEAILPVLESHPETQPYAAWLKSQMDYLDVAEEVRKAGVPARPGTNQPPVVIPNPPPQSERELWRKRNTGKPLPAGAAAYVAEMKPVFAAQNVPPQLVWVAEVESGFDRRAESPAGAAGLFQLMPDTARRFGLSLWPRDERFQAVPSATASAEYLKYLYGHFHDWRLAVAAYNAGEGTVRKQLIRHQAHSFDEIAVHLPAETQMYVPRVESVLQEREGAGLEQLPPAI